jgi:hypothetical protein
VRAATALAEPFRGAGQVVKEFIHVAEHERRAPELALALDPRLGLASEFVLVLLSDLREVRPHRVSRARHRAVIETQKAAQNWLKKRRATTATHLAVGSRHRDDVVRWNEEFCSLFSSVFFSKFNKQCIKKHFIRTTFCS